MAKKEETAVVRFKKSELVKVGEEMNEILVPDPSINTSLTATLLEKEIVDAAALVDPADPFSESTWKVLGALANVFPAAAAPAEDEGAEDEGAEDEGGEDEGAEDEGAEDEGGEDTTSEPEPVKPAKKEKPAPAAKKEKPAPKTDAEPKAPRARKTLWAPGTELKVVRAGSKLAAALDIMKAKKFKNCSLADFEPLGWNEQLAKAYVCYDINKLGYGSRFQDDGVTFDLVLPEGCKMPAHKEK